jgi:hypothetical protein
MSKTCKRVRNVAALLALSACLGACVVYPAGPPGPGGGYGADSAYYAPGVAVAIAPPAPQVEVYGAPPTPGFFWVGGYWNWVGGRHVWVGGHWQAPRAGYHWVPHNWVHERDGWHLARGHWARR